MMTSIKKYFLAIADFERNKFSTQPFSHDRKIVQALFTDLSRSFDH